MQYQVGILALSTGRSFESYILPGAHHAAKWGVRLGDLLSNSTACSEIAPTVKACFLSLRVCTLLLIIESWTCLN
eukprot:5548146-Amphidinium_carterae.2